MQSLLAAIFVKLVGVRISNLNRGLGPIKKKANFNLWMGLSILILGGVFNFKHFGTPSTLLIWAPGPRSPKIVIPGPRLD